MSKLKSKAAMATLLGRAPDFVDELTQVEEVLVPRGHVLIKSPKCHPEIAGLGIEYLWGKSKQIIRRETNDYTIGNLERNVLASMAPSRLTLDIVRRMARRTREYTRVYEAMSKLDGDDGVGTEQARHAEAMATCDDPSLSNGYLRIEKMLKEHRSHRNILDMDMAGVDPAPEHPSAKKSKQ